MPPANKRKKRQKKPNIFTIALKSTPKPTPQTQVFPYDYKLLDFNTHSFNSAKFKGAFEAKEVEELKQALRTQVKYYEVPPDKTQQLNTWILCFCCVLSLLFIPAIIVLTDIVFVPLALVFLCLGFCCLGFLQHTFRKGLMEREVQIQSILNHFNHKIAPRGFKWTTGKYGAYLILWKGAPGGVRGQVPQRIEIIHQAIRNVPNPPKSAIPVAKPMNQGGVEPYGAPNFNYPTRNQIHPIGMGEPAKQGAELESFIQVNVPREPVKI